ncbi:hypothetical protein J5751_07190 [bacterium]|nr:hypothetical protein [bacterium]
MISFLNLTFRVSGVRYRFTSFSKNSKNSSFVFLVSNNDKSFHNVVSIELTYFHVSNIAI